MSNGARIGEITISLPDTIVSNHDIAARFPDWSAEKIEKKLGITTRHILSEHETAVDLAVSAAEALFKIDSDLRSAVDYVIFCTQSPDFTLPTSACIIQDRLNLGRSIGAIDVNQGCSGYVYTLGLAKGLISAELARCVLVLTADGYSKLLGEDDASVRTIFGDAGTATIIERVPDRDEGLQSFLFGTDGSGAKHLIVRDSGMRSTRGRPRGDLHMNGPEVLNFTLREVPPLLDRMLAAQSLDIGDLDFIVLHQANKFILDQLRRKLKIPEEKLVLDFADVGNTVSSTIPIVLSRASADNRIKRGDIGALLGFGVGLSWAGCILRY